MQVSIIILDYLCKQFVLRLNLKVKNTLIGHLRKAWILLYSWENVNVSYTKIRVTLKQLSFTKSTLQAFNILISF